MTEDRIRPNQRTVFRRLEPGAGAVLLHLDTGDYRQLNETGALIWSLLEDSPTRPELIDRLRAAIRQPPRELEAELEAFLTSLRERGLVDIGPPQSNAPA
jgi:hypothetical protein